MAAGRFEMKWYWLALGLIISIGLSGLATMAGAFSADRPCSISDQADDKCGAFVLALRWWIDMIPPDLMGVAFYSAAISYLLFLIWAVTLVTHHTIWRRRQGEAK